MKECPRCKNLNAPDAVRCSACGALLKVERQEPLQPEEQSAQPDSESQSSNESESREIKLPPEHRRRDEHGKEAEDAREAEREAERAAEEERRVERERAAEEERRAQRERAAEGERRAQRERAAEEKRRVGTRAGVVPVGQRGLIGGLLVLVALAVAALLLWSSRANAQLSVDKDGRLCYVARGATRAELKPLGVSATADGKAHCLTPLPVATSYQLVAYGWLGIPARSDTVVVAPTPSPAPTPPPTRTPAPPTRAPATAPPPTRAPATAPPPTAAPTTIAPAKVAPAKVAPVKVAPVAPPPAQKPVAIESFRVVKTLPRRVCVQYRVDNVTSISITNRATGTVVYSQSFGGGGATAAEAPQPCIYLKRGVGETLIMYELEAKGTGNGSSAVRSIYVQPRLPPRKKVNQPAP